ncbi:MAG: hypothetical protein JSR39_03700 [Verrucomicrobia bacterium]|nr:hypothetical protein [Verrucomicrobiota bacterium]
MEVASKESAKGASGYRKLPWKVLFSAGLLMGFSEPLMAAHDINLNDHWNLTGDFVFMRRQYSTSKAVVKDFDKIRFCGHCRDFSVLRTNGLINEQGFEPGFRVGATYRNNPKESFEGLFLWVAEWDGQKERKGNESLFFGFKDPNYDGDYIFADEAKGDYDTQFWTTEANYWRHWTPRNVDYFSLSGIFGLRYFHFNEGLDITYVNPPDKSHYKIHTKSDAFGIQGGLDLQVNPSKTFHWEMFAKFGFMMDHEEQKQLLRDLNDTVTLRNLKRQKWQNGCFIDLAAWFDFQFKDHLNLHAGYEMIFLSSVCAAEDQISRRLTSGAGKQIDTNGTAIIHGLFAGMTISF